MPLAGVGMVFRNQRFDHVDDFSDVMSGLGHNIRWAHAEGGHILLVGL